MSIEKVTIPSISSSKMGKEFYTVLSVELGNTTIKSIIITTNIKTNKSYELNKCVDLTRNVDNPGESEEVFGHTIWNKPLSGQVIEKAVSRIIKKSLSEVGLDVSDLDFVVRSTGVVALSSLSYHMDVIIKSLSNGCLNAGIKPSQMMAPFSINNIPEHIRKSSFFNNIKFDGSIVGVASPKKTGVVSNEMESQLVTAGIKLASKSSTVDYRNPVISIDMGTTLAGEVVDDSKPYGKLVCNYIGLAGGISDIMLRGCDVIEDNMSTIDIANTQNNIQFNEDILHKHTIKLHEFIDIMKVPKNLDEFGQVRIDLTLQKQENINIIGSRINNSKKLITTFNNITQDYTNSEILLQIDDMYAYFIKRLIDQTSKLNIIQPKTTLGITGRAGITGYKPYFIEKYLKNSFDNILFTPDGLALGALMMARCMNSLGTPINPVGGSRGGMCIMQQRIKLSKKR